MLEVEHISKSFAGRQVLADVSLGLEAGDVAALLGNNGAGKTTLLRIICRLVQADSGEVRMDGHRMIMADLRGVGYLPEERGLYRNMGVEEQAVYLARLKGLSCHEAKESVGKWFARLGMEEWRRREAGQLSKGMQQRLQFVVAVAHRPRLLLLDEPFSGFDTATSEMLCHEIQRLSGEGTAVLLATHNMQAAKELSAKTIQL